MILVIMGVSGSGKSTVGKCLSEQLGWIMFDGDNFHPEENINKMSRGVPLTDQDRLPWLLLMQHFIQRDIWRSRNIILLCSSLRRSYRDLLRASDGAQDVAPHHRCLLHNFNQYLQTVLQTVGEEFGGPLREAPGDPLTGLKRYLSDVLKAVGREQRAPLASPGGRVAFVFLRGRFELIRERLFSRQNHFMPAELLQSQFDTLEPPTDEEDVITVDVDKEPAHIAAEIIGVMGLVGCHHCFPIKHLT